MGHLGRTDQTKLEIEIKIEIADVSSVRERILTLGYKIIQERHFEDNWVYDTADGRLREKGFLLRLRSNGSSNILTFKRPKNVSRNLKSYKVREEIETIFEDFDSLKKILAAMDYKVFFRYQKYREVFRSGLTTAMIDETPIGDFLEIEGSRDSIDSLAKKLGYSPEHYIKESYFTLFQEHNGKGNMIFT